MDYTAPQFWPQLKQLAVTIDTLDYFQILNLPQTASTEQIRGMYYGYARALHPDKFFHLDDEELKKAVTKIYKRITESYTVLKDEAKRRKYVSDINGPERNKKLRFNEDSEAEQKQETKAQAEVAKTPKGKQLYQTAVVEMNSQQWDKAYRSLQSALLFEPSNEELKKLLADVAQKRTKP